MTPDELARFQVNADGCIAGLRQHLLEAQTQTNPGFFAWATGSSATLAATKGNLDTDGNRIELLNTVDRQAVMSGLHSAQWWGDRARNISDDISYQAGVANTSGPSVNRFFDEVVVQSSSDLKQGTLKVVDAVDSKLPFYVGAVVLGLIAYAVIKVKG